MPRLREKLRSIVSLVAFGDDGLIIVEVANGERFFGIQRGHFVWSLKVTPATGEADIPWIIADKGWTEAEQVYASVRRLRA